MTTITSFSTVLVRPRSCSLIILLELIALQFSSGQIELYTHHPFLPTLVRQLQRLGLRVCATYLIESQFMEDKYKFFR